MSARGAHPIRRWQVESDKQLSIAASRMCDSNNCARQSDHSLPSVFPKCRTLSACTPLTVRGHALDSVPCSLPEVPSSRANKHNVDGICTGKSRVASAVVAYSNVGNSPRTVRKGLTFEPQQRVESVNAPADCHNWLSLNHGHDKTDSELVVVNSGIVNLALETTSSIFRASTGSRLEIPTGLSSKRSSSIRHWTDDGAGKKSLAEILRENSLVHSMPRSFQLNSVSKVVLGLFVEMM